MNHHESLIIGAGAAGLVAGIVAARVGKNVVIYERATAAGQKLLCTGGGRCNLSNAALQRSSPAFIAGLNAYGTAAKFVRPVLQTFDLIALQKFFRELGVEIYAPPNKSGTANVFYYPRTENARDVLNALLTANEKLRVKIIYANAITALQPPKTPTEKFRLSTANGAEIFANQVLVAIGGDFAQNNLNNLLAATKHHLIPATPALAALTITEDYRELAGIGVKNIAVQVSTAPASTSSSAHAVPKIPAKKYFGDLLFTHHGVSGPAILNISGDVGVILSTEKTARILLNFLPDFAWQTQFAEWRKTHGRQTLSTLLATRLPNALAKIIVTTALSATSSRRTAAEITKSEQQKLIAALTALPLTVTAAIKPMVTRGGVDLAEVTPRTLESKLHRGLFFAGEALNVDGKCGGFNLHWALASGANFA